MHIYEEFTARGRRHNLFLKAADSHSNFFMKYKLTLSISQRLIVLFVYLHYYQYSWRSGSSSTICHHLLTCAPSAELLAIQQERTLGMGK